MIVSFWDGFFLRCELLVFGGVVIIFSCEETLRFAEVCSSVFPLDRIHWDGCGCFLGSWAKFSCFFSPHLRNVQVLGLFLFKPQKVFDVGNS